MHRRSVGQVGGRRRRSWWRWSRPSCSCSSRSCASGVSVSLRCTEIVVGGAAACRASGRDPRRPFTANGRTYRRRDPSCCARMTRCLGIGGVGANGRGRIAEPRVPHARDVARADSREAHPHAAVRAHSHADERYRSQGLPITGYAFSMSSRSLIQPVGYDWSTSARSKERTLSAPAPSLGSPAVSTRPRKGEQMTQHSRGVVRRAHLLAASDYGGESDAPGTVEGLRERGRL